MTLRLSTLIFQGYLYFLIPLIIFILGWLKLIYGIPVFMICCYVGYLLYTDSQQYKETLHINIYSMIFICVAMISWITVLGVIGGFPQSGDMLGRNAMFKDLVELPWPVIYPKSGAVVYYHGAWLVPALLGKLFGYTMGQLFLLLWIAFGLVLMMLLLSTYLNINTLQSTTILICIIIGMNGIAGVEGGFYDKLILISHSNSKNIYFLNNQIVGIWLLAMLFMFQRSTKNFVFLGISSILYSSYIIPSILPLMMVKVYQHYKEKDIFQQIFSQNNLLTCVFIFPILFLYFIGNGTITVEERNFTFMLTKDNLDRWFFLISMIFLIYMSLIFPLFKKDPIFYTTGIILTVLSTIQYGWDHNFGRSLLFPVFIVTIYVSQFLFTHHLYAIRKAILCLALFSASGSNSQLINSQILYVIDNGFQPMKFIDYRTTSGTRHNNEWANQNYKETTFFKYLAKQPKL